MKGKASPYVLTVLPPSTCPPPPPPAFYHKVRQKEAFARSRVNAGLPSPWFWEVGSCEVIKFHEVRRRGDSCDFTGAKQVTAEGQHTCLFSRDVSSYRRLHTASAHATPQPPVPRTPEPWANKLFLSSPPTPRCPPRALRNGRGRSSFALSSLWPIILRLCLERVRN